MTDTHAAKLVHVDPQDVDAKRMHPLVHAALSTGNPIDPEMLNKLLDVQERWEAGEARKAFTRAVTALKADLPSVVGHDSTVDFTSERTNKKTHYTHASLAAVMDAITEPLTRHGFSLSYTPQTIARERDIVVRVTCRLTHSEGHFEEATLESGPDMSGSKSAAQGIMSTITLLSRYTACSLLGIATKDMREPTPEDSEERAKKIDPEANQRAVAAIAKAKKKREDAEKVIGKPVAQWTLGDLTKVRAWLDGKLEPTPAAAPDVVDAELVDEDRGEHGDD